MSAWVDPSSLQLKGGRPLHRTGCCHCFRCHSGDVWTHYWRGRVYLEETTESHLTHCTCPEETSRGGSCLPASSGAGSQSACAPGWTLKAKNCSSSSTTRWKQTQTPEPGLHSCTPGSEASCTTKGLTQLPLLVMRRICLLMEENCWCNVFVPLVLTVTAAL